MTPRSYYAPAGGTPAQTELLTDRAVVTEAYTVIPRGVLRDGVVSRFPGWRDTRAWILAHPISGFSTTFSQSIVEVAPGGGSDAPEPEAGVESVVFVLRGEIRITIEGAEHVMGPGGYAYLSPGSSWTAWNTADEPVSFQWIRKAYAFLDGVPAPASFVTSDADHEPGFGTGENSVLGGTAFVDASDIAHDMQVNIVTVLPGGTIPFAETHTMEHGLYVLEGKGVYLLNKDWVEVQEGDFMWLRAYCPQACYAGGPGPFRYLLYKDINRQIRLTR